MSFWASSADVADVAEFRENIPLNIHFPNYVDADNYRLGVGYLVCNAGMMPDLDQIITRDIVKWAISSFEPFKSPSPDEIFLALLQHAGDILHECLVDVYKDCLQYCNITDC